MPSLTAEQETRLRELVDDTTSRIDHRRQQLTAGEVAAHYRPTAHVEVADGERTAGIAAVYDGNVTDARRRFEAATEAYQAAVEAAVAADPWATAHKNVPEYCQAALFTAMLAADSTAMGEIASTVHSLPMPDSFDDGGFHTGQYHLAYLVADAVEAATPDDHRSAARDWFEDSPKPVGLYVDGVIALADGLAAGAPGTIQQAVETLVEYHEADRHADNVVDAVMAVEATGAAWLAHHHGHTLALDDEFVPAQLTTE